MERIGIKRDAKVVDLTQKEGTVASLLESKIFCTIEQKVRKSPDGFVPWKISAILLLFLNHPLCSMLQDSFQGLVKPDGKQTMAVTYEKLLTVCCTQL